MAIARLVGSSTRLALGEGALPSAPSVDEPKNDQKQYCTDGGGYDRGNDPGAEVDAQLRQQPTADQGADDPNAEIGNETVAGTSYNLAGQPSRDEADQQNDEKALT